MQDLMAQVKATWAREAQIRDGQATVLFHVAEHEAQECLDDLILEAAAYHHRLWQALLRARLEACTEGNLPLAAKLQLWISDMIRMWQGNGPEETSGDYGLKHIANAVRKRRIQMMHEEEGCPEVETDAF